MSDSTSSTEVPALDLIWGVGAIRGRTEFVETLNVLSA
jgi:hypothetical protein